MTHKEALTLARQLLWRYRHETPIGNQPHMICQEVDEAFERIDEALAQPEQEPVAWPMEEQPDGSVIPVDPSEMTAEQLQRYTTPPQRKPLTSDELNNLLDDVGCSPYAVARAIEFAHGIKEEA